jgi:ABC-type transport system involved in cytochrome c biogenesis permease component
MLVVMNLVNPVFLALSMFPACSKPFLTWAVSFLTLGFCKIWFSLISGLSSLAMVLSSSDNVDMLVTLIVLGLLAPVLAVSVASGSGLATLSSIGYSAQPFKISTGVVPCSPQIVDNQNRNGGGKNNDTSS